MARGGLEPPTPRFSVECSTGLSYLAATPDPSVSAMSATTPPEPAVPPDGRSQPQRDQSNSMISASTMPTIAQIAVSAGVGRSESDGKVRRTEGG
jgi:hypothetical protein